jgi:hypothetical protein
MCKMHVIFFLQLEAARSHGLHRSIPRRDAHCRRCSREDKAAPMTPSLSPLLPSPSVPLASLPCLSTCNPNRHGWRSALLFLVAPSPPEPTGSSAPTRSFSRSKESAKGALNRRRRVRFPAAIQAPPRLSRRRPTSPAVFDQPGRLGVSLWSTRTSLPSSLPSGSPSLRGSIALDAGRHGKAKPWPVGWPGLAWAFLANVAAEVAPGPSVSRYGWQ